MVQKKVGPKKADPKKMDQKIVGPKNADPKKVGPKKSGPTKSGPTKKCGPGIRITLLAKLFAKLAHETNRYSGPARTRGP